MRTLLLALLAGSVQADVPGWMREIATTAHPAYPPQTKAVVLLNEEKVTVDETGRQVTVNRRVVKVLTLEGKSEASGILVFDAKDSKVRDFKAWVIQPSGKTKEFSKKEFTEGAANDYHLYSTLRFYGVRAAGEVEPNSVFAFESTVEEKSVFSQFSFAFQSLQPHLLSRFQVTVPNGWRAEARAYQGAPEKPSIDGATYTWESRNMKFLDREPGAPRVSSLVPRISVSVLPPDGSSSGALAIFKSWKDVSVWESGLTDAQSAVTPAIEAKARALAEGKAPGMEQIRAVGEFVQKIRYVAVAKNLSKGGGYVPHKAEDVLASAYGDCKDKANLMRALLKPLGVSSWLTGIMSGDPRYTKEDWASPHQFNHEIIAIQVPAGTKLASALDHPELGRIVLFDPTDPHVPFGYLPDHEQDSFALIVAGEKGSLTKTPRTAPSENHTERTWEISLNTDGSLTGTLKEVTSGQEAFDASSIASTLDKAQRRKLFDGRMSRAIPGSEIVTLTETYDEAARSHRVEIEFKALSYARIMKGKLWMIKSSPMPFHGYPNVNKAAREQPLVLDPVSFSETVLWKVPANLKIDELPDGDRLDTGFAKFRSEWKAEERSIRMSRSIEVESKVVPAAEFLPARELFLRFNGSEVAPIVLVSN